MKLWGGRFTKEENQLVHNFNASISFDQKMYRQDIRGSIAHVTMLAKQGILSEEDKCAIIEGLKGILKDVEDGTLLMTPEYEDIHSFVESNLIDRIGEAGKRLHTGRSRNDQVALDMKLYTRGRDRRAGRPGKEASGDSSRSDGGASGHLYAGLYPSSEGPADYVSPPSGSLL